MEYFIGLLIQLAGILLLARLAWSIFKIAFRQTFRVLRAVKSTVVGMKPSKPRPMAVPKAPGMPRLAQAFSPQSSHYDMAMLEIPTYLRRQSAQLLPGIGQGCTEFN